MNPRVEVLKQLVADELYVIDEMAVAEAVFVRSVARRLLPGVTFAGGRRVAPEAVEAPMARVRSFRPHRGARSFRLSRAQRRPLHGRAESLLPVS